MRELGVPFLLRWFMWAAVRLGSLTDRDGRVGWLRDLPAVLLVTLVAVPVVALPAVAIVVGVVLFGALELLVWPVLLVGRRLRTDSDREVNRPDPGFRT